MKSRIFIPATNDAIEGASTSIGVAEVQAAAATKSAELKLT